MAKPQSDGGEFLWGPCGEHRKWWRQDGQGLGEPCAKWPPGPSIWLGQYRLQMEHSFSRTLHCPAAKLPTLWLSVNVTRGTPLPSSEECLPFSVCFPSRKQPGASAFQPRKQKIWGWGGRKSSHSCTSQISESSGGSFLSCRRSANTCSEWTLLSVRRLTSFISIRGNISRSWGWWMET